MTSPGAQGIVGRVFSGRYEVLSPIARGGMAEVYQARDNLLGRPVALKVLHPEFAVDQAFVERFRREAQAAANLNHPHIVAVYDWGQEDGTYFMVMEYVQGRTLRDLLKSEGRLSPRRTVEIAAETAAALHFAHRHGVVHRDVKPGNILCTTSGETKVTDFGIARAVGTAEGLTQTGAVIGTATYFSPEQAQGFATDPRTDVYSLGVVMYEVLTGQAPFRGDSPVAVAYKHVREQAVPMRQLVPELPRDLEAIVAKCMAKDADNRYQSAEELRQDLARFAQGQPVRAAAAVAAPAFAAAPTAMVGVTQPVTRAVPAGPASGVDEPMVYEPRRPWGAIVLVTVLITAVLVALLFLAKNLGVFGKTAASAVEVPNVAGVKYEPTARQIIENMGLAPAPVFVNSDSVPDGIVVSTEPAPGAKVNKSSVVRVSVSVGRQTLPVPDVVLRTRAEAAEALTKAGFKVGKEDLRFDDKLEKDRVLSQDPPSGKEAPKGSAVNLVVSQGKERVKVPVDLAGKDVFDAQQRLLKAGLQSDRKDEFSDKVETDRVIRSDPGPDTEVDKGSTVALFVSKGPDRVKVPKVTELDAAAARQQLENLGLTVNEANQTVANPTQAGKVIAQNPEPGTDVNRGSSVTITVGRSPVASTTTTTTRS